LGKKNGIRQTLIGRKVVGKLRLGAMPCCRGLHHITPCCLAGSATPWQPVRANVLLHFGRI